MIQEFLSYCKMNDLVSENQKVLIAISGGADSVVLSHLFYSCKIPFALAHCNFKLRGTESDADEQLVRQIAEQYKCQLFINHFDTTVYAKENKISIEMAARDLRYEWFEQLRKENNFDSIATAHHQEDNAETLLLNLIRGTGLRGLLGIKCKTEKLIRPLLFADKAMILSFAQVYQLTFRVDESNNELVYKRNKLRNVVFPILKELNPSVVHTLNDDVTRIAQSFAFYEQKMNELLSQLVTKKSDELEMVSIKALKQTGYSDLLLFEWLHPFGFTQSVLKNVSDVFKAQSGKRFIAGDYELVKDRGNLVVTKQTLSMSPILIYKSTTEIESLINLRISHITKTDCDFKSTSNTIACIDSSKLLFPLTLRQWQHGDMFVPLGMKTHKKLSDFFIDKKIPLYEKKYAFVLVDANGEIVWVVGHRISDVVKIDNQSVEVLKIETW